VDSIKVENPSTRTGILNREILPHAIAVFQFFLLIIDTTSILGLPSIATGRKIGEAHKIITPFQLWIFGFSLLLVSLFYLIRRKSVVEKSLFLCSFLTGLISSLNLALFLVDDFLIEIQITAMLTVAFYVTVFVISGGKLSILFLLSVWRQFRKSVLS
jgi:hypothetical protein